MLWIPLVLLASISGMTAVSTACGVNMVFAMRIARERTRPGAAQTSYLLGSVLGAVTVGGLLGVLGVAAGTLLPDAEWPNKELAPLALMTAALVLGAREIGALRFALPQRRSQVNSDALTHRHIPRQMFSFGFWLGTGFLTYSPYGGLHLLALACIASGSIGGGALLFAAFGLARAVTVIAVAQISADWIQAGAFGERIAAASEHARLANVAAIGLVVMGAGLAAAGLA